MVSAQVDIWFGRRKCLKISMMAIQGLYFTLVFAQMNIYMPWRKILFEVLKIAVMVAQHNDSAGCESTIPSLMPYKNGHRALQICRWFLEF